MKIAVTTTREDDNFLINKGIQVSKELNIPFVRRGNLSINKLLKDEYDYLLVIEKERLTIKSTDTTLFWHPNMTELKIKSIKDGNVDPLACATGIQKGDTILDCTLGFAGDSMVFSYITGNEGKVVGIEYDKYIAYLTQHGLKEYTGVGEDTKAAMNNIKVVNSSYEDYLLNLPDNSFDIVYFDPMFKEPNKKSSSINGFRAFANHNGLTKEILDEALRVCKRRVVVKERNKENNFEKLGIEKTSGGKRRGDIIYGIIEKKQRY